MGKGHVGTRLDSVKVYSDMEALETCAVGCNPSTSLTSSWTGQLTLQTYHFLYLQMGLVIYTQ